MATLSRDDVAHLAMLARLDLSDAELDAMTGELGAVLDAFAKVGELDLTDVPGMSHPIPVENVARADEPRPGLAPEQALSGAPEVEDGRFSVPRILAED